MSTSVTAHEAKVSPETLESQPPESYEAPVRRTEGTGRAGTGPGDESLEDGALTLEPTGSAIFPHSADWTNPRVVAILETAANCFAKGGFTATTLADIGKELGLRKSIVHYYFASKAALVHEVQSMVYGQHLETVRHALGSQLRGAGPTAAYSAKASDGTAGSTEAPGTTGAAEDVSGEQLRPSGLASLWAQLSGNPGVRALNMELWSEGRRDSALASRALKFDSATRSLVAAYLTEQVSKRPGQSSASTEDLATLTMAVLDGLSVLAEREGDDSRATRAYSAFLQLLGEQG